jgi:hypothetical protein
VTSEEHGEARQFTPEGARFAAPGNVLGGS